MTIMIVQVYGMKYLQIIFGIFVGIMAVCFWINLIELHPSFSEIFEGCIIPYSPPGAFQALAGLVGSVIMPHNLFLHSSLVLQETRIDRQDYYLIKKSITYYYIETGVSLFLSILINLAIIATFAQYYGTG